MKSSVIAALLATVQSAACENDTTKNTAIILTATQNHYNDAAALSTADVTNYEAQVNTKLADIVLLTTARDDAITAGEAAAKAAETTIMPAAEATAVTTAEGLLQDAVDELNTFKTTNAAYQTILDNIASSQLALTHAEKADAEAVHRCVSPTQKAHYDTKIAAEKEMWGYDKMTDADKKIFDDYITQFTNYHQDMDAKMKEQTEYYKMTDAEKAIYDKLESAMKEKDDYYDEQFDKSVKKEMASAAFEAMTDDEKKAHLNKMRDDDFQNLKNNMDGDFIDLMSEKAMKFFDLDEGQRKAVQGVVKQWQGTRDRVKDGINLKMASMMRELSPKLANMTDAQKMQAMNKIKQMGQQKMGEFLKGMTSDESQRFNDGYFSMNDGARQSYDSVNSGRRQQFEQMNFFNNGWNQQGQGNNQMGGMNGQRQGMNGQQGNNQMGGMNGQRQGMNNQGNNQINMKDMFQKMMYGNGDNGQGNNMMSQMMQMMQNNMRGDNGQQRGRQGNGQRNGSPDGRGRSCSPQGGRGRSGPRSSQCGRGQCCAMVRGQGMQCMDLDRKGQDFRCVDAAKNMVASAAALATAAYVLM